MSTFTILVTKPPFDSQDAYSAYRFTRAACEGGHKVDGVFFYSSGVHCASNMSVMMSDEMDLYSEWLALHEQYNIPLHACISAANRRGVLSSQEADTSGKSQFNVEAPFQISGLGEFFGLLHQSDRLVQF